MYLYGASGHAKVIIDILSSMGVSIDGLIDDNPSVDFLMEYRVFHKFVKEMYPVIVSIGDNQMRRHTVEKLFQSQFGIAIDKSSTVSKYATIGEGTVVMQGAIIQSCASIGKHCIINTGASIDHECVIDDYVHIAPHSTLCGNVYIGEGTLIGVGSAIIPGIHIGKWSVVCAGSVITKDLPDYCIAHNNEFKIMQKMKNQLGGVTP